MFTSPIWFGLLALAGAIEAPFARGAPPSEMPGVFIGIACATLALACAGFASRNLWRRTGSDSPLFPFGTLVVLALVPFWDFTTSGLESSLVFLWLGASFLGLTSLLSPDLARGRAFLLAFLFGLGPLVRPDLGLFTLLFLNTLLVDPRLKGRRLACLAVAGALPAAYELFRMGYFASLLPNTALAKEPGISNWPRGARYLGDFLLTYQLWIPLALLLPLEAAALQQLRKRAASREFWVLLTPILGGLAYALFVVRWGGDFLHARMLLPALFAVAIPFSLVPVATFRATAIALCPWVLASTFWFRTTYLDANYGIERGRMNYVVSAGVPHPVRLRDFKNYPWVTDSSRLTNEHPPQHPSRAVRDVFLATNDRYVQSSSLEPWFSFDVVDRRTAIGMFSFSGRQRIYVCDVHGLADPIGGHQRYSKPGEKSGHDKVVDPAWCLGRILTPSGAHAWHFDNPTRAAVEDAQDALGCGDLPELVASVTAPLDRERFWRNVRMAPELTRLRIPGEPASARTALCGPRPEIYPSAASSLAAMRSLIPPRGIPASQWILGVQPPTARPFPTTMGPIRQSPGAGVGPGVRTSLVAPSQRSVAPLRIETTAPLSQANRPQR